MGAQNSSFLKSLYRRKKPMGKNNQKEILKRGHFYLKIYAEYLFIE